MNNKEHKQGDDMEQILKKTIRDIPDFPKPGIIFKDITPILQDHKIFSQVINAIAEKYKNKGITAIAGIESRGFLFGTPLAERLELPFIPIRKKGKLPYKTIEESYDLEYGKATIEMHIDAVKKGDKVLVVDDLLATGGTAEATCKLIKKQEAEVYECVFVIELGFLNGREKINAPVFSLVKY